MGYGSSLTTREWRLRDESKVDSDLDHLGCRTDRLLHRAEEVAIPANAHLEAISRPGQVVVIVFERDAIKVDVIHIAGRISLTEHGRMQLDHSLHLARIHLLDEELALVAIF